MSTNKQLNINGINVELIRSKRRTLGLELSPRGLKARAPLRMREQDVINFVLTKQDWIEKHKSKMPDVQQQPPMIIENGAQIQLRGREYCLVIETGRRSKVRVQRDQILVPVGNSSVPLEQRVKNKLVRWYKGVAHHELQTRAKYYAALMNVTPRSTQQIYVRDYKRRWGSCDSKGKLSFNWRIIQAPTVISDYVVIHELAHCHEFNHSPRFWNIVATQMPNYKDQELWLQHNGHQLYRL